MKIIFLGVGEAFDPNQPNNSQLIISNKTKILLDCGFTTPWQLWKVKDDPNFLDAVYISHWHADHYFGLPGLLLRMWEGNRTRPFTIISQKGFKKQFKTLMNLAYLGFIKKFNYKINILEVDNKKEIAFNDSNLSFSKTIHSCNNLAIKVSDNKNNFIYTGDGAPVENKKFYSNADLLVMETYLYNQEKIGHSSIVSAINFAEENSVKCLALTHMNRDFRKNDLPKIKDKLKSDKVKIVIPEPLDEYSL